MKVRARATYFLKGVERGIIQDNERQRVHKPHSLPGEYRGDLRTVKDSE
jgi:hypothetical protein